MGRNRRGTFVLVVAAAVIATRSWHVVQGDPAAWAQYWVPAAEALAAFQRSCSDYLSEWADCGSAVAAVAVAGVMHKVKRSTVWFLCISRSTMSSIIRINPEPNHTYVSNRTLLASHVAHGLDNLVNCRPLGLVLLEEPADQPLNAFRKYRLAWERVSRV